MTFSPFFVRLKLMTKKHFYHCLKCNKFFSKLADICQHDPYYEYIEVLYDYAKISKLPTEKKLNALYISTPLQTKPLSLGEGHTPLVKLNGFFSEGTNNKIYVKNEGQNPTGSFKDRESSFIISRAREKNIKNVFVVSSGNAALSAAVYANKARISCECFVPKTVSKSKKLMLKLYNSSYHLVEGDYEEHYRKAIDNPPANSWNITSGYNFFREEGSKRIAYEIWQKISVPDSVIIPIGNGTLFSAIHKGFSELQKVKLSEKIPQLIGVQIKNASPISEALKHKREFIILKSVPNSIAEGIVARESYSALKVIRALKESHGKIIEVTDAEVKKSLKEIIKEESLTPEPTSAVVYAALKKINLQNKRGMKIVCIQTGNGMKNLEEILEIVNG